MSRLISLNNKIGIFIVCRQSSKRFPNKIKEQIFDLSLLDVIILRLLRYFPKKNIVICTSYKNKNSFFNKIQKKYKIKLFYGSDRNLFDRYINCLKKFGFNHFVRVTGDNPFTDILAIKKIAKQHIKNNNEYTYTSGLIRGSKPEIFSLKSLIKCKRLSIDQLSSEYLTFFYLRKAFKIQRVNFKNLLSNQSKISISIDKPKNLSNIKKIILRKKEIYITRNLLLKKIKKCQKIFYSKKIRYINLVSKKFNVKLKNDPKNFNKIDLRKFGIV